MKCPNCQGPLPDGAATCPHCSATIVSEAVAAPPSREPTEPVPGEGVPDLGGIRDELEGVRRDVRRLTRRLARRDAEQQRKPTDNETHLDTFFERLDGELTRLLGDPDDGADSADES